MSWDLEFREATREASIGAEPASGLPDPVIFPAEYRAIVPPALAVRDARRLRDLLQSGRDQFDFWEPRPELGDGQFRLQYYGDPVRSLDELMPLLANLGLRISDQVAFRLSSDSRRLCLRSFAIQPAESIDLLAIRAPLIEAIEALLDGVVENDELNGLLPLTGLSWREIDIFRAYRNYSFQLGSRFDRVRFHRVLLGHPELARLLFRYFEARFRPDERWQTAQQREDVALTPLRAELATALDRVQDNHADRLLRDLFNLIDSTLRTDFYRPKTAAEHFIALKFSGLGVISSPAPKPLFEVYVHARWMEGIHLRGARVARGGIRWSDRPDDFRSEILGLMQTQMVKNALIVPLGAKGGYVLHPQGATAESPMQRSRRAYATLIRGLLNLTDNRRGEALEPPPAVVAYDPPDPYLVVAADKGTAGFSDLANQIAAEYDFWLGDAFASGGSSGYHHKRLGITARGAWICVRHHCREAGLAGEDQPYTVVGVGSMDGDVFGNGMLLSDRIQLIGAFGSHSIFLDPNPDPVLALAERRRLFESGRGGWEHYDRRRLSPGGGVFPRTARDIALSPEVRARLGTHLASIDGEGLIRLLLKASVDLLWFGGVGTYVKATDESDESIADRANDNVRITAAQVRARIVGEGANLAFTQQGRVEFALAGGRINTDAIDNSAGVDLSDHEVNLKILLSEASRGGTLGEAERDRLLHDSTSAVVAAVLADSASQALCLSLERERCRQQRTHVLLDVADRLSAAGLLDRAMTRFPARREVLGRGQTGLTRPELAVLMAQSKLALKRALLARSEFLSADWIIAELAEYFPAPVRAACGDGLPRHGLAAEIAATRICNQIVDHAGSGFLALTDELDPLQLFRATTAYLWFDRVIDGPALRRSLIRPGDLSIDPSTYPLLVQWEDILIAGCDWALAEGRDLLPTADAIAEGRAALGEFLAYESRRITEAQQTEFSVRAAALEARGLAREQATRLLSAERLAAFPAIAMLAAETHATVTVTATCHDGLLDFLELLQPAALLAAVKPRDRWERRAQIALSRRLRAVLTGLVRAWLRSGLDAPEALFAGPVVQQRLQRLRRTQRELTAANAASLLPFVVLVTHLEELREAVLIRETLARGNG